MNPQRDYCSHCGTKIPHISVLRIFGIGCGLLSLILIVSLIVYFVEREPPIKTREFKFTAQEGTKIVATTQVDLPDDAKHLVLFTSFLEKTDGNMYLGALNSFWEVYGKERGLFQLQDAKQKWDLDLGGMAICWQIANPAAKYCVFPIKDGQTSKIAALHVWVEDL